MNDRRLFFNMVEFIEIEISSSCNRSCIYCPNSIIKRKRELFPIKKFEDIMLQLKEIDYDKTLAFHQYNEPLLEKEHLFQCIKLAKKYIPNARLSLYTNGDLLTHKLYKELIKSDIDEFHISCQTNKDEVWNKELALKKVKSMKRKIGRYLGHYDITSTDVTFLSLKLTNFLHELMSRHLIKLKRFPVRIYIDSRDYLSSGSTRLNVVKDVSKVLTQEKKRSWFCPSLVHCMHISYKGNAHLCWDCCEGTEEAKKLLIGSIYQNNIYELYKMKQQYIVDYLYGETPKQCTDCLWNRCV